jgi:uncharacterized protein (TIGR03435 family)
MVGATALLAMIGAPPAAARRQDAARAPAFEVASVKRTPPIGNGAVSVRLGGLQGNRWAAEGVTLFMLIRQAYGQQYSTPGLIIGGPQWIQTDRFSVTAVAGGKPTQADTQLMLQHLLAERFKLVVRKEKRELPVYLLTLARDDGKLGRELRRTEEDCEALQAAQQRGEAPLPAAFKPDGPPPPCTLMMMMGQQGLMRMQSGGATLSQLASMLSQSAGRPVLDRTGLTGYFSYTFEFARDPGTTSLFGGPAFVVPPEPTGGASATSDLPSIFAAVQEQLGLKLEPRQEPIDVLVIESVQPPTED